MGLWLNFWDAWVLGVSSKRNSQIVRVARQENWGEIAVLRGYARLSPNYTDRACRDSETEVELLCLVISNCNFVGFFVNGLCVETSCKMIFT